MDPSYWQIDPGMSPPPAYDDLSIVMGPDESLAIEAPPDEDEGDEVEGDEDEDEDDEADVNKIFDGFQLPNYDDVQMRLGQPEMTPTLKRNYLDKVVNDAERMRKSQITVQKTHAYNAFKRGEITQEEKDRVYKNVSNLEKVIKDYKDYHKNQKKKIKGKGMQKGRRIFFYNDAKELLQN